MLVNPTHAQLVLGHCQQCIVCLLQCGGSRVQNHKYFIKLFSCSSQLSIKFELLINTEIALIDGNFRFRSTPVIYPADKC